MLMMIMALVLMLMMTVTLVFQCRYDDNSSSVNVGVNPEILKNTKCRNFLNLTVMYVKVYISRMEMGQRIHFWHQNLLKITIF